MNAKPACSGKDLSVCELCNNIVLAAGSSKLTPEAIVSLTDDFILQAMRLSDDALFCSFAETISRAMRERSGNFPEFGASQISVIEFCDAQSAYAVSALKISDIWPKSFLNKPESSEHYIALCKAGIGAACLSAQTRIYEHRTCGSLLIAPYICPPEKREHAVGIYGDLLAKVHVYEPYYIPQSIERSELSADNLLTLQRLYDLKKQQAAEMRQLSKGRINRLLGGLSRG